MTSALLLCRLQRLEDVRRLSHRSDVPLNQKVDESRDHGGYFRVLLRVVREQPFMCRVVAQLSHRVPDRHLVSWQFQIFNSVVKVLPFAAEVIDQPFKGYAQQCACSPWRRARNRLRLQEGLLHVFGHALRRSDPRTHRPDQITAQPEDNAVASIAPRDSQLIKVVPLHEVRSTHFSVVIRRIDKTLNPPRLINHFRNWNRLRGAVDLAVRAGECCFSQLRNSQ